MDAPGRSRYQGRMAPTLVPRPNPDDDRDNVVVPLARAPHPDGPRDTSTSAINRRTLDRHWIVVSILAHLVVVGALLLGLFETSQPIPPPVLRITLVPQGPRATAGQPARLLDAARLHQ